MRNGSRERKRGTTVLDEERTVDGLKVIDACADMLGDMLHDMHPDDPTARKLGVISAAIKREVADCMPREISDEEFMEMLGECPVADGCTTTTW